MPVLASHGNAAHFASNGFGMGSAKQAVPCYGLPMCVEEHFCLPCWSVLHDFVPRFPPICVHTAIGRKSTIRFSGTLLLAFLVLEVVLSTVTEWWRLTCC